MSGALRVDGAPSGAQVEDTAMQLPGHIQRWEIGGKVKVRTGADRMRLPRVLVRGVGSVTLRNG